MQEISLQRMGELFCFDYGAALAVTAALLPILVDVKENVERSRWHFLCIEQRMLLG